MNIFTIFTKNIFRMDKSNFTIKFGGQDHQIEANTLVNTLIHYSAIINQINDIYGEGNIQIDIRINALKQGSFEIGVELLSKSKELIDFGFIKEAINYTAGVVTILGGLFGTYKFLKGKPARETDIKSTDSAPLNIKTEVFLNIYNNQTIRSAISNSIETISNDEAVESLEIIKDNKPIAKINKNEFYDLVYDEFDREQENPNIRYKKIDNAILSIISPSFEKNKKWFFLFNGNKLPAIAMKDPSFLKLIDDGVIRFAKGDAIKVQLEITQEFNDAYNAYENKKYRIIEFLEYIPREVQGKLFE